MQSRGCRGSECINPKAIFRMNYVSGNLILRYLSNQCTSIEERELNNWLDESLQNRQTFNYLKLMWSQMN